MRTTRPVTASIVKNRLGRGIDGLLAPLRTVDISPAATILSPAALALFQRMSNADQAHCLRVFTWLQTHEQIDPDLLMAGLLHDCGKAAAPIAVWQRTLKVLLLHLAPARWRTLSRPASPSDRRYPFYVLAHHPIIGADWVLAAGCSPTVVWLIRQHESDPDPSDWRFPLMRALQDADAAS